MKEFRIQRTDMKKIMDDLGIYEEVELTTNTRISFAEEDGIVISYMFEPHQWKNLTMKELFNILGGENQDPRECFIKVLSV